MRTRVKICGITRPEDAVLAADLGADALGLVFHEASDRCVTVEQAQAICQRVPPFVAAVGLFMDSTAERVRAIAGALPLAMLQFHGSEAASFCRSFGRPYLKAIPMGDEIDVEAYGRAYPDAAGLILDSHARGRRGGTGEVFDWSRIPQGLNRPVILAGGLTPDNVSEAVARARPYGVDVSSGVEAERGVKDRDRMNAFIRGVYRVDQS